MYMFSPDWLPGPPGDTIADYLVEQNISIESFAQRMGLSPDFAKRLIIGDESVTDFLAEKLVLVIGASKGFWLRRQYLYEHGWE
jgi:plasmid maintenance system antidote protein VapI